MGALTSKPFTFAARAWELFDRIVYDFSDTFFSSLKASFRGVKILRILPKFTLNSVNEWISDRIRFSYDSYNEDVTKDVFLNHPFFFRESWFHFFFKRNKFLASYFNVVSCDLTFSSFYRSIHAFLGANINFSPYFDFRKNYYYNMHAANFEGLSFKNFFFMGVNLRYETPVYAVQIRRLCFSRSDTFFISFGFFTNNLFSEYNFGSSTKIFISFIRGGLKPSRLLRHNSLFLSTSKIFHIYSNFFIKKKAFVLTSRPSDLSLCEHALHPLQALYQPLFHIYMLHPFSSYFIHIKNSSYTRFDSFNKLQPFSYDFFFNKFTNRSFAVFDYFCVSASMSSFTKIFRYSNFYTHFNNKITQKSIFILISIKRHCDARSNFTYYN